MRRFETQDDAVKLILKAWGRRREIKPHGIRASDDYADAADLVVALDALGMIECPVVRIEAKAS